MPEIPVIEAKIADDIRQIRKNILKMRESITDPIPHLLSYLQAKCAAERLKQTYWLMELPLDIDESSWPIAPWLQRKLGLQVGESVNVPSTRKDKHQQAENIARHLK